MALRTIRVNDDPCLYKKCRQVTSFDERLSALIDDMIDTLHDANGVGLAAPQIGILRRVAIIDTGDGPVEMINPVILAKDGVQGDYEGCLSFPGESGYVERANHVVCEAFDRSGNLSRYEGEGLFARAVQHELDHLDGLIYKRLIREPPEGFDTEDDGEDSDA